MGLLHFLLLLKPHKIQQSHFLSNISYTTCESKSKSKKGLINTLLAYIPNAKQHSVIILALFRQLIPFSLFSKLYSSSFKELHSM